MRSWLFIVLLALSACSSPRGTTSAQHQGVTAPTSEYFNRFNSQRASASNEDKALTLQNVFLGHANPRKWEPGDQEYFFPVPAEISYGYSPLKGYKIEVSSNCKNGLQIEKNESAPANSRDNLYRLYCAPNGDSSKRFALTTASKSFGSVAEDSNFILGTSFTFTSNVKLTKTAEKMYLLEITAP